MKTFRTATVHMSIGGEVRAFPVAGVVELAEESAKGVTNFRLAGEVSNLTSDEKAKLIRLGKLQLIVSALLEAVSWEQLDGMADS